MYVFCFLHSIARRQWSSAVQLGRFVLCKTMGRRWRACGAARATCALKYCRACRHGNAAVRLDQRVHSSVVLRAGTGLLRYNWSNVCMHFFRVSFLRQVASRLMDDALFHVAHKQIPSRDGPIPVRFGSTPYPTPIVPMHAMLSVRNP